MRVMCACVCVCACVCMCVYMYVCMYVCTQSVSLAIHTDHPFGRLYRVGVDPTSPFSDTENTLRTEEGVNGYLGMELLSQRFSL